MTPEARRSDEVTWQAPIPGGWARDFRFGEWLGDPVTPLFETWLLPMLEAAFWRALRRIADMPTPQPTYVLVNGWYFTSMNFWPRHAVGWLWQIARHPRLLRVLLQFVPALAGWALAPWEREWRREGLPHYRTIVQEAAAQVDHADPQALLRLVERVGAAAGDYFAWVALVAGAGYKTEASLAQFYRQHLSPTLGGTHQWLLAGVADPALPAATHAVHSLDWFHPTLADSQAAGNGGSAPDGRAAAGLPKLGAGSATGAPPDHDRRADGPAASLAAQVRARIGADPRRRQQFERLLATARRCAALREEVVAQFTLGWPVLRRATLRLGDALVQRGALDHRDDLFFLTHDELVAALERDGGTRLTALASQRRQEWERRRALVPPLRLGQLPEEFRRGVEQLETSMAPGPPAARGVVRGRPVSPGVAAGPARIIRGPDEFHRLQPGDVLVAPATAPAWTPLFARAAAVVTDTGGVLSHTSLVAREYGIPAIVGVGDATARLRDGQVVRVDGATGVVEPQGAAEPGA